MTVNYFANVFDEAGVFVFYDNFDRMRETIVTVPKLGSSCPDGARMDAASPINLVKFDVRKVKILNEAPDWGLIYALIALMLICVILLVILAILWRPRSMGIYPIAALRPKYKTLGAPIPSIPIPGVNDYPDGLGPRGDPEGASATVDYYNSFGSSNYGLLENFNTRTLYDKIEDQTLHISSQLARHQADLRGFYDRISQQTEGLKQLLEQLDVSQLAQATENAAAAKSADQYGDDDDDVQGGGKLLKSRSKDSIQPPKEKTNVQYALTGGAAAREAELQKTLYQLLERYKNMPPGGFGPIPGVQLAAPGRAFASAGVQQSGIGMITTDPGVWEKMTEEEKANIIARGQPVGAPFTGIQYTFQQRTQDHMQAAMAMGGGSAVVPGQPIQFEAGNFGKLLKVMNAERMQLEAGLREEENEKMKEFSERKEHRLQDSRREMSFKLADMLSGDMTPTEMQAIIDQHNLKLEAIESEFNETKDSEQNQLLKDLSEKHETKLNQLIWRHEQMALANNMKLADVGERSGIPHEIATQQLALDLVALEESKAAATGTVQVLSNEAKEYNNDMSENFSKQLDILVENGSLFADQAQLLINEEQKLSEKHELEMEDHKSRQMESFKLKLAERRAQKLRKLQAQQEAEKQQALQEGTDPDSLNEKHEKEAEVLNAKFDAEEAEQLSEIVKKLNDEHKDTLKQAHRNILNELVQNQSLDSALADQLMDQLRKDTSAIQENLESRRQKHMADIEAKIAARKARRQEEVKRQGQEKANDRILEQQALLAVESQPTNAVIDIPTIIPGESAEEQALKREQQRALDELKEKQESELRKLENQLVQEAKTDEQSSLKTFEDSRQRAFRELKNKQAAELTARSNLSSEETEKLLAAHHAQLENIKENFEADKAKQLGSLQEKIAAKRKAKADALKKKQENEMAKEVIEQKKELADTERNVLKDKEREAMLEAIRENGTEATEYIIRKVLEQRQAREMANLEQLFREERKLEIDKALVNLDEKHAEEKDVLRVKQEDEYNSLASEDLSPDELQQRRTQLLNQQQLQMAKLEKSQHDERTSMQKAAVSDWELRYAKSKLELKEKHYKEFAEYLSELSADQASEHQSSIKQAQEAARELQEVRENLEKKKHEDEERLKKEAEAFEKAEQERMAAELERYEEQLERDAEEERKKNEKAVLALNSRKEALLKEKKLKAKQDIENLIKEGSSKEEQEALLKQHSKDLAKVMNKMDADRMRLQSQLEERLRKKKEKRKKSMVKDLESKANEARQEFTEQLENEEDRIKNESTMILKETINIDNLVKASIPEAEMAPSTGEMPTSYLMTAPMSDNELVKILLKSPLYMKLQLIKDMMNGERSGDGKHKEKLPLGDQSENTDEYLVPVDMDRINAREFVVYKFSCFVKDLLAVHCLHQPVHILLAEKIPPNKNCEQNTYSNAFHYDRTNRILYLRREQLENVGQFNLVLMHTLTHIHVGDMSDDTDPKFIKEFYKALSVVCSDLFLSRYKRANALNEAVMSSPQETASLEEVGKKVFENIFEDAHDEIDRNNVVNDLLDTKLIRNKNFESQDFDREFMFQRLHRYTDFIVGSKLRTFLDDVEDKLAGVKKQGSHIEIERRLKELQVPVNDQRPVTQYVPSRNLDRIRDVTRQNSRNIALARSPLPLSFTPSRQSRSRSAHARKEGEGEEDFYETFLKTQIDELQNKIDELDYEFISLTRHSLDLSSQVKDLEGEVASLMESVRSAAADSTESDKLADMVRSSIKKLNAARSQLTHAMVSKSERLKRLEAYRKELEERDVLLKQHRSKPAHEKAERGERKLQSSLAKSER